MCKFVADTLLTQATTATGGTKQLRSISIIAWGSRGDIQPYIAIALALERAGYSTRILTNGDHRSMVESFHLKCVHVLFENAKEWGRNEPLVRKSFDEGDPGAIFAAMGELFKEESESVCERFSTEMRDHRPDLLLVGSACEYFELYATVALGLPTLRIQLNALSWEKRAPLGFPTLPFGLHNWILFNSLGAVFKSWECFDDALEALPGGRRVLPLLNRKVLEKDALEPRLPILVCKSESFKRILNPSIHSNYKFVGGAIVDQKHEVKHSASFGGEEDVFNVLEEFLSRDESRKPVYIGWGSMICKSPEYMVMLAVEALLESNQRGIILGGSAELTQQLLETSTKDEALIQYARDNILFVDQSPHEWLLHRVSAAVHHGGAGTTNASIRAGIPTIVSPIFVDQFDNSYLVEQLGIGVGFSKHFSRITAKDLAGAISRVTHSKSPYKTAARSAAAKLQEESGAETAVKEIEQHWRENVTTGKWREVVSSQLKPSGSQDSKGRKRRTILVVLATIGACTAAYFSSSKWN